MKSASTCVKISPSGHWSDFHGLVTLSRCVQFGCKCIYPWCNFYFFPCREHWGGKGVQGGKEGCRGWEVEDRRPRLPLPEGVTLTLCTWVSTFFTSPGSALSPKMQGLGSLIKAFPAWMNLLLHSQDRTGVFHRVPNAGLGLHF